MKLTRLSGVLCAATLLSWSCAVPVMAEDTGGYVRFAGGLNFAEDPALDVEMLGPGKLKLDTGFRIDLAAGYDLNRWVGLEFSAGYIYNSAESVTLLGGASHLNDTWLQHIPLLGHVIVHFPNRTDFLPYLSAGGGGVVSTLSINRDTDTAAALAYELAAGVIYKLDDRAWLDFGYKYFASLDTDYQIAALKTQTSKVRNHFIGASVIWRF